MHMELQARLGRGFVRSDVNKRMYQKTVAIPARFKQL